VCARGSLTGTSALLCFYNHMCYAVVMDGHYKRVRMPAPPRAKGITEAILALSPGEAVLLPTNAGSLVNTVGTLRRTGRTAGTYTVRQQGKRSARIWRLT
jgi:hypothetical protein